VTDMKFYRLTHPRYDTDREFTRRNPVTSSTSHSLPGMTCEVCGPWASSDRLRVDVPPDADDFTQVEFLPVAEWTKARDGWAKMLNVAPGRITPGAEFGPPIGTCSSPVREDVVHPIPGEIWVAARVRDALTAAGLTGVSFAAVQLPPECDAPDLSELVVHGRAWRHGSTEESLRLCEICGRRGFLSPRNLGVDEARWDGSDFVFLDGNPNIVVVTDRVAEVFNAHAFTNVVAEPIA
jgi:hypothetical protein